jgi:hypothetical protein
VLIIGDTVHRRYRQDCLPLPHSRS